MPKRSPQNTSTAAGSVPERALLLDANWAQLAARLGADKGLAVVALTDDVTQPAQTVSDNSLCQALQKSPALAQLCQRDCGGARARVWETGATLENYKCHAGLNCVAARLRNQDGQPMALICGKAFTSRADYETLLARFYEGDLQAFLSPAALNNVIIAAPQDLQIVCDKLVGLSGETIVSTKPATKLQPASEQEPPDINESNSTAVVQAATPKTEFENLDENAGRDAADAVEVAAVAIQTAAESDDLLAAADLTGIPEYSDEIPSRENRAEAEKSSQENNLTRSAVEDEKTPGAANRRKTFAAAATAPLPSIFRDHEFIEECGTAVSALAQRQGLKHYALFLRDRNRFTPLYFAGRLQAIKDLTVEVNPADPRLNMLARANGALALREQDGAFKPVNERQSDELATGLAELYPLLVGDETRAALLVADGNISEEQRRQIAKYCREISMPLEVLRLRHELSQSESLNDYLTQFAAGLNALEDADPYLSILRHPTELLRAERSSLMVYDENANELEVVAGVNLPADATKKKHRAGDGVSGAVVRDQRPLMVRDIEHSGQTPAAAERRYKTKSFISYPIKVRERIVGILNVTDKLDGSSYNETDLTVLDSIAPQMALALDRAEWRAKAAKFQQMSITDALTGLLNRRYLVERMTEEIKRSERHQYAMCFLMLDIDDFKNYNDRNGHPEGDTALEITALSMKSALRAMDVAARYGGEEFCVLLPQTTLEEARIVGERIRQRIETTRYPHGHKQPLKAVTASIGIAAFDPLNNTVEKIIAAADRALYEAKARGKNRVQIAD